MNENMQIGRIIHISGPVVGAIGLENVRLSDVVLVGEKHLIGEVIRLSGERVTVQVYEDTSGVRIGEPIQATGASLAVTLGPGLLGQAYDGLQRPLQQLAQLTGDYIERGMSAPALPEDQSWTFVPQVSEGDMVTPGTVLGSVQETAVLEHFIMVAPDVYGRVTQIQGGEHTVNETIAVIENDDDTHTVKMAQKWPTRIPRPFDKKLVPFEPIITGTRVIDTFFPVVKGGAAIIPGGFGTGKTVVQHTLARWSDVDVVVYVGCGERGNEMTEVLDEFPQLDDPRTGEPLMRRTVLIANTSDMPVAAREASVYTGITIAEYYRDMGLDVLMLADSTSRWGEALREISGRLEEMPGEEGYPAYLGARLSEFYERAGQVIPLSQNGKGSVTLVGAISPPGGDFSEPMTQHSMRVAGTFWALDYDLSRRRHFPAISWIDSYSFYNVEKAVSQAWVDLTGQALALLQQEAELQEIVQLVGQDALSESDRLILFVARMLREDFLQQSAFDDVDQFSPLPKTQLMLKLIMRFQERAQHLLADGISLQAITSHPIANEIARMKMIPTADSEPRLTALHDEIANAWERSDV